MTYPHAILTFLLIATGTVNAQEDFRQAIRNTYTSAFEAMQKATTKREIENMVHAMDVPEWVSNLPDGTTMTRSEAIKMLDGLLEIPPGKRPVPKQQFVYMTETSWNAQVLYWVYRQTDNRLIGALARDTWVKTTSGWRRMRHEKFFPDRPLSENGKSLILQEP